jgi:iron complex transport system permease protein
MKTKKTRIIITYIVLFTLLLGAILLSLYIGSVSIAPRQVFSVLTGHGTDAKAMQIILSIRLPRVLAAAILGGALAVSGFLLQTFFRNPIAGPFVLGISSGRSWLLHLR